MSKFWICDSCKMQINPGEEGRVRWWEDIDQYSPEKPTLLTQVEILCMKCHAVSPNRRNPTGYAVESEFWLYLEDHDAAGWVRVFMGIASDDRRLLGSYQQFAKMVNRVVNGDGGIDDATQSES